MQQQQQHYLAPLLDLTANVYTRVGINHRRGAVMLPGKK